MEELEASLATAKLAGQTASVWLLSMARTFRTILDTQTQMTALVLEFWTQARRDEAIRQAVLAPFGAFQRFFQGIITEGIEQGDIRPVDPVAGAQVLLSLASGLFFQGLLDPEGSSWGEVAETSIRVLLDGLGGDR